MHPKSRLRRVTASRRRRRAVRLAAALATVGALAAGPSVAAAEPQGSYCNINPSVYGDECIASALHPLTRSSAYSSSNLYVSAGAYNSGGGVYGSLVYGTGFACHTYGSTWLYGRARNSQSGSYGSLTGSKYWNGTTC